MRIALRVILSLFGLLLVFVVWGIMRPELWWRFNHKVPTELEAMLRSSDSPTELIELPRIVLVKEFSNSEWFAIAYRDTHAAGPYSCSIIRCSDGDWYDSKRHYCGQFGMAKRDLEVLEDPPAYYLELPPEDLEEIKEAIQEGLDANPIGALLEAENLDEAKARMTGIGFIKRN